MGNIPQTLEYGTGGDDDADVFEIRSYWHDQGQTVRVIKVGSFEHRVAASAYADFLRQQVPPGEEVRRQAAQVPVIVWRDGGVINGLQLAYAEQDAYDLVLDYAVDVLGWDGKTFRDIFPTWAAIVDGEGEGYADMGFEPYPLAEYLYAETLTRE